MSKIPLLIVAAVLSAAAFGQAEAPLTQTDPEKAAKIIAQQSGAWKAEQRKIVIFYEREVAEAEKKHNWDAIARRLAPDFLELGADGNTYTKEQAAELFKDVKVDSYKMSEIEVRALAPAAAIIAYKLEVDASFKGQPMAATYRVSSAWARVGGAWLMKFHQVTVVPK